MITNHQAHSRKKKIGEVHKKMYNNENYMYFITCRQCCIEGYMEVYGVYPIRYSYP
jgi:hypothetical protein